MGAFRLVELIKDVALSLLGLARPPLTVGTTWTSELYPVMLRGEHADCRARERIDSDWSHKGRLEMDSIAILAVVGFEYSRDNR